MVCFETKEEANIAIQELDETTSYIAKECEPKNKVMKEYGEVKSLKLRFHPNITRTEAICFSTEKEAQLAITEINTYKGWRAELYKPISKSREFEKHKNQIIATRNMNKEKTKVQPNK